MAGVNEAVFKAWGEGRAFRDILSTIRVSCRGRLEREDGSDSCLSLLVFSDEGSGVEDRDPQGIDSTVRAG